MKHVYRTRNGFVQVVEIHPDDKDDHDTLRRAYPGIGAFAYVCVAVVQPLPRVTMRQP